MSLKTSKCIFLSLLTLFSFTVSGQIPKAPNLLIPYNYNGVWGYSDTLGNILIPPKFESARLFRPMSKDIIAAEIFLNQKRNYLLPDHRLLFPEELLIPKLNWLPSQVVVIDQNNKKRVLSCQDFKFLALPDFAEAVTFYPSEGNDYVLFKADQDTVFTKYSLTDSSISLTDIVKVEAVIRSEWEWAPYESDWYLQSLAFHGAKKTNNRFSLLLHNLEPPMEKKEFMNMFPDNTDKGIPPFLLSPPPVELLPAKDKIVKKYEKSHTLNNGVSFNSLHIISENGLLGIVNEKNETILSCIYDDIEFFGRNRYVLLQKNGKVGIKDFFGAYNTIEPKYERINYDIETISGHNSSEFTLYKVRISGQDVYVGENGMEFFHFD